MSKILINNAGTPVEIADVGVTVDSSTPYTIPPQDYATFAASSDVISLLASGLLVLNDGGTDITVLSQAVDIIKGWPIQSAPEESTPFFFDFADQVVGEGPHIIYTDSIVSGVVLELTRIVLASRVEAMLELFKNGSVVASLRTGAAHPKDSFDWWPVNECVEGDSIELVLTKRAGAPDNTVGVHLMGVQKSTT